MACAWRFAIVAGVIAAAAAAGWFRTATQVSTCQSFAGRLAQSLSTSAHPRCDTWTAVHTSAAVVAVLAAVAAVAFAVAAIVGPKA